MSKSGRKPEIDEKLIVVIILVVVALFVIWFLPMVMFPGGMMGWGMMGFGWMGPWMFFVPLLFIALMILGAYYLLTGYRNETNSPESAGDKAFEILRERFAKGEITKDQYMEMKEELES